MSVDMLFDSDEVCPEPTAEELWQDAALLGADIRDAELALSRLSLELAWLKAEETDALAVHNELWREEQLARRVVFNEEANAAKDFDWQVEAGYLRSWADCARDYRHSDAVDWRYLCACHRVSLAEEVVAAAGRRLTALRRSLQRVVQDARASA